MGEIVSLRWQMSVSRSEECLADGWGCGMDHREETSDRQAEKGARNQQGEKWIKEPTLGASVSVTTRNILSLSVSLSMSVQYVFYKLYSAHQNTLCTTI